jgi:hypothetical protein
MMIDSGKMTMFSGMALDGPSWFPDDPGLLLSVQGSLLIIKGTFPL